MKDDKKQSARQEKIAKWRKFARKRWVYPAVYLGLAAIVIAAVLWMQVGVDQNNYSIDKSKDHPKSHKSVAYDHNGHQKPAVPVNSMKQIFEWPVKNQDAVQVTKQFWDPDASLNDQQAALVYNDHTYRPNTGINLASKSGDSFVVTAAMSGTVVQAENDPDLGYVVRVDDGKGVTTVYSSLKSLAVEQGDLVKQGEKLGMAGKSDYFDKAGVILHFEIRANGEPVNPVAYFGQSKADLLSQIKGDQKDQTDQNRNGQSEEQQDQGTSGTNKQGDTQKQKQDSENSETNQTSKNA
ncbi:MAG TPA: M23 family metallopeptidase [Bacillales bacterium]|nr:M23 family metallopeptidase [Bacillales bacterium]